MAADDISARIKIEGAKQAQKDLQAVGKEAKKLDGTDVEIGAKVDDEATKKLKDIEAAAERVDAINPVVQADAETTAARSALGDLETVAERVDGADPTITADAQTTEARATLGDVLSLIERLDAESAQVVLAIRGAEVQAELGNVLLDIAQINGTPAEIEVKIARAGQLKGEFDQISGAITKLENKKVEIPVKADTDQVQRDLEKVEGSLKELTAKLKARQKLNVDLGDFEREMDTAISNIEEFTDKVRQVGDQRPNISVGTKVDDSGLKDLAASIEILRQDFGGLEMAIKQAARGGADDFDDIAESLEDVKAGLQGVGENQQALLDVEGGARRAADATDDLGKSADSSKSVLANMVGNSVQDLGALGGMAGSAGVAIGQMGEYIADAFSEKNRAGAREIFANFGKVAGPIALIGLALKATADVMTRFSDSAKRTSEAVDSVSEAVQDGSSGITAYGDHLKEMEQVTLDNVAAQSALENVVADLNEGWKTGLGIKLFADALGVANEETENITPLLNNAGIELDQWLTLVQGSAGTTEDFAAALRRTSLSEDDQVKILEALGQAQDHYATGTANAAEFTDFFGAAVEDATGSTRDFTAAGIAAGRALQQQVDRKFGQQMAAQHREATAAAEEYRAVVSSADFGAQGLSAGLAGMKAYNDQFFSLARIATSSEEAIDSLSESVKENGLTFDLGTEAGRANQEALEGLAGTLEVQLAGAYDAANGDMDAFKQNATEISLKTLAKLADEMGLSAEQTAELGRQLGITEGDWEARFKLAGQAEAMAQLGLLQGSLQNITDTDWQAYITTLITQGDYVGAVNAVQGYYAGHPLSMYTKVSSPPNASDILNSTQAYFNGRPVRIPTKVYGAVAVAKGSNSVPWPGGIAGEEGPEFIRTPGGQEQLLTQAAFVPPGTRVTSTRRTREILHRHHFPRFAHGTGSNVAVPTSMTVNVNAAVIGNRFDVARAVSRATRDARRIQGSRG